jgi:alkylhydroperoxidase family enzyme
MAFIKTIPPRKANGETREAYNYMAEVAGNRMVAKIVQIFSLRPASMKRMIRQWELAMWKGSIPRQSRELAAAAVSRFNSCHY